MTARWLLPQHRPKGARQLQGIPRPSVLAGDRTPTVLPPSVRIRTDKLTGTAPMSAENRTVNYQLPRRPHDQPHKPRLPPRRLTGPQRRRIAHKAHIPREQVTEFL